MLASWQNSSQAKRSRQRHTPTTPPTSATFRYRTVLGNDNRHHVGDCSTLGLQLLNGFRLIPKADRKKIHEYLFREGVLVAKKDFELPKHNDIDTKNLYVIRNLSHWSRFCL